MKGTKYLSELVDCSALQKGQLNVIKAPTGSGKTYFALNYIPSLTSDALHNVVYLIDTINGKEQIVRNYNATSEYYGWSKEVESGGMWFEPDNRVVVITYAKFGVLFERNIEFYKNFSYIICDEIHSPRLFPKRKEEKISPEIYPTVAFRKPTVFLYTFGRAKRAVLTAEKALFSFRK